MSENPNKPTEPTVPAEKEGMAAEHGTHTPQANATQTPPPAQPTAATQQPQTPVKAEPQRAMPQGVVQAQENNILNIPNPHPTTNVSPFQAGHKYNEVAQYDNFFNLALDSAQHIFDAVAYFSDEKNRSRYTYDQQQLIISRIIRACQEFGISVDGVSNRLLI